MQRLVLSGLAMCAALLLVRQGWAQTETMLPSPPQPGTFTLTIKSGGFDRVAHIHIPKEYKPGAKLALVLMLHGAGSNGMAVLEKDGWAAKSDKETFLAVAPDGLPLFLRRAANFRTNPRLWNYGQFNPESRRGAIDDVAFIRQLLDELKERVPYDESRVFCTGHSNGGSMTFRLATELSERFTAIGSVAGLMALGNTKAKKPLPTLFILGTKDPFMPLEGGEVKLPWGTRHNPPVSKSLNAWAKALGCETEPRTISDKDQVKKVEYPSRTNGPTLTVLYLEGHGHHWPGGQKVLPESMTGPITSKLDATDTLWEFFQASHSQ